VEWQTAKSRSTKRPRVTKRTIKVKGCDNDDNIRAQDDETLTGIIVVEDCPCEKRFKNNATRLAALSATLATQLRNYYQNLYKEDINCKVVINVLSGNATDTVFTYIVKVPKSDHERVKTALKQTCKDEQVSYTKRDF
jgi:hypothetical protein